MKSTAFNFDNIHLVLFYLNVYVCQAQFLLQPKVYN